MNSYHHAAANRRRGNLPSEGPPADLTDAAFLEDLVFFFTDVDAMPTSALLAPPLTIFKCDPLCFF